MIFHDAAFHDPPHQSHSCSIHVLLKPVITFMMAENPAGGMRLASIHNPEKIWMFGDGEIPIGKLD